MGKEMLSRDTIATIEQLLALAVRESLAVPHERRLNFVGRWLLDRAEGAIASAPAAASSSALPAAERVLLGRRRMQFEMLTVTRNKKVPITKSA